jgi:hypothetical protein
VTALWKNVEHFVLLRELAETGEIMDLDRLDGQRFVLGARNSGAEQTGRFILDTLGIDYEAKFRPSYMGYGPTADALRDGNIRRHEYSGRCAGQCNHPRLCADGEPDDDPELDRSRSGSSQPALSPLGLV